MEKISQFLNDISLATILSTALLYVFYEWLKKRNTKEIDQLKFKAEHIDKKTLEIEKELYLIFTSFCLQTDFSEDNCIDNYEKIRTHIIHNGLFIREGISDLGSVFADYILEEIFTDNRDLQKEEDILKKFKKLYRN